MAAYAYFDENGNLLEFISDRTLRQGNSEGVNKIYVYMEPEDFNYADKSLRCTYKDINTNTIYDTTIGSILDHIVSEALPTFKDYDPTHFVSGKIYPFIEITVPGAVMELEGSKVLSLAMDQLVEDTEADPQYEPYLEYASVITFYVNESVIQYTETISKSQYDYLLSLIGSVDAKIYDKSRTIFKVVNRIELGNPSQWAQRQVFLVLTDSEYSDHMTLLERMFNHFTLLYDFNDHYTKSEVDGFITTLTTAINGKSTVSGTTDAQDNWYTLTIDGVTHRIGGSGGGANYKAGYGILIDSANYVISADLGVLATKLDLESYATTSAVSALSGRVTTIEGLIPAQASSTNQLADKNFVNSSIATNTAYFIGTFGSVEELTNIGILTPSSILKAGSFVTKGSVIGGFTAHEDSTFPNDYTILLLNASLATGSVIKSGSTIYTGSWINHIYYNSSVVTDADITIETLTNNDYANVINSERDFASTTEMNAFDKSLLTNFDYAWIPNNTKYDLYRFSVETQTWTLQETNIAKTDVSLPTVYNRYTYNAQTKTWSWNYSVNTSGFTAAQWAAINSGITSGILSGLARENELADAYSSSATYAVGDYAIYNNTLYRCTTAITTAEDFDSAKWTACKIANEFVDKSSAQTITGVKSITDGALNFLTRFILKISGVNNLLFTDGKMEPSSSYREIYNLLRLGTVECVKLKDNATNTEIKTVDIANGLPNVINASDIVNNTLTQAQYDLITNGKPTIIKGIYNHNENMVIFPGDISNSKGYNTWYVSTNDYSNKSIGVFICNNSKVISMKPLISTPGSTDNLMLSSLDSINGKTIPAYPSSPAIPQSLDYLTDNTLAYEKVTKYNSLYEYASNSTTQLEYETINNISISADTTYTLATAPSGTYPEYKGYITNGDSSNSHIITLTGISKIKCNNGNIVITEAANSTVTIPASKTLQFKIQNGKATFFDWDAPWADAETIKTQATGGATSIQLKTWVGTQAQYDSILTKDANTQYIII